MDKIQSVDIDDELDFIFAETLMKNLIYDIVNFIIDMNKKPKYFILDVDGVITNGQMIYDHSGKKYKIFGQDDHDSLKIMKKYLNILFISGDRIGFKISKKRVEDMGFKIKFVPSSKRAEWIDKNLGLKNASIWVMEYLTI